MAFYPIRLLLYRLRQQTRRRTRPANADDSRPAKAHLVNLQQRFPQLAAATITTSPDRDYRYRIVVPKSDWVTAVAELTEEQTWSNFKNEAARFQGSAPRTYVHALHEVWSVMYKTQRSD